MNITWLGLLALRAGRFLWAILGYLLYNFCLRDWYLYNLPVILINAY